MKNKSLLISLCILLTGCNMQLLSTTSSSKNNVSSKISSNVESSSTLNSSEQKETVDIIVMAGQSNMEGHSWCDKLYQNTSSTMHNYYRNGFKNTLIMYHCNRGANQSEKFTPVKAGQGYGTGSFGPEVGIAEELYNREYDKNVYLIKYAVGGTNLFSEWNVNNPDSLYYQMVDYVYDQLVYFEELGLKPVIKGFFWMQGEADSCWDEGTSTYYNNLSNMVESFREEFEYYYGDEERGIAFVDAGISDCSSWINYRQINEIKQAFANEDEDKNYYIDTIGNGLEYKYDNTDYYHFDATSEIKLGKLFISTLLDNEWLD